MTSEKHTNGPTIVTPFWRTGVHVSASQSADLAFLQQQPRNVSTLATMLLPQWSAVIRQNVQRVLVATMVAEQQNATVLFVEGLRGNRIDTHGEDDQKVQRHITGSHMSMHMARLFQNTGVISRDIRFQHVNASRCTDWEADVALSHVPDGGRFIGIAGPGNEPSEERAAAIVRSLANNRIDAEVHSPNEALDVFGMKPTEKQHAILQASALSKDELLAGAMNEADAKRIQRISDAFHIFGLKGKHSLISYLASVLPSRKDKPRRIR